MRGLLRRNVQGSSPRMRGKRTLPRHQNYSAGLIPAHAGKTEMDLIDHLGLWAHPRACGENTYKARDSFIAPGSSPRMRGKRRFSKAYTKSPRLIPAHAGKTNTCTLPAAIGRAHPRACGENARDVRDFAAGWGSSPRMRGKLGALEAVPPKLRLIPAHAGKTSCFVARDRWLGAHPRACGENFCPH